MALDVAAVLSQAEQQLRGHESDSTPDRSRIRHSVRHHVDPLASSTSSESTPVPESRTLTRATVEVAAWESLTF
jgi:hypothetical protein